MTETPTPSVDFVRAAVAQDLKESRFTRVHTRFPPEPNGYLHIGHAKAISIDFGVAQDFGGKCNLRFDDTNPVKEEVEYVDSIMEDIRWLGYSWDDRLFYASDYFEQLYDYAIRLIKKGKAYICDLTADEVRQFRGTLTEPGKESPYRNRSVEENLDLFQRMRHREFPDGARTLRAKIDMASGNINLRDPVLYRIIHEPPHHRTGNQWCMYPMYDFAHGQCDSLEGVTHSLCSLEYEDHRPLYDWFCEELGIYHPRQIEFARLKLTNTVLSKRKLLRLVKENLVGGWDDPRMPTLRGLRRRGYTPEAIRDFCARIGVAKNSSTADLALLEHCLREDLNKRATRVMGVLNPLRVVIENYPEDQVEELEAVNNPEDAAAGTRRVPFGRVLYIEQDDFRETPPPKYYRLSPGREVRLRYAYFIKCVGVVKDNNGNVVELRCTCDPATRGGDAPDGRKVKSTIHWVSAAHALESEVRLYDRLFTQEDPDDAPEGQ
ncbi:MAG: glutamine--tRNA ligase/YqeY domain fusion protein, partial [Chloroflexota bacterium]